MKLDIKPLTINKCWRGGRRFRTREYLSYTEDVSHLLRPLTLPEENLELNIRAGFSNSGADLDNMAKPFIDILQKKYGFNDNRIYKLTLIKEIVAKGKEYIDFELKSYE